MPNFCFIFISNWDSGRGLVYKEQYIIYRRRFLIRMVNVDLVEIIEEFLIVIINETLKGYQVTQQIEVTFEGLLTQLRAQELEAMWSARFTTSIIIIIFN